MTKSAITPKRTLAELRRAARINGELCSPFAHYMTGPKRLEKPVPLKAAATTSAKPVATRVPAKTAAAKPAASVARKTATTPTASRFAHLVSAGRQYEPEPVPARSSTQATIDRITAAARAVGVAPRVKR
ncbi:hypothetical protein [Roseomonas chloroacetimidivorans]|uniref:hypothetical protein n=1 Tax=Roseomonas chloroacetimidivorans TaxID=1766656 RepID=UPI003C738B61